MAEKNILSKPFQKTYSSQEGTALRDIFYTEVKGKQEGNNFLPGEGRTSAQIDVYREISSTEYNTISAQGEESQNFLKIVASDNPNNPSNKFLVKDATIENNQVVTTQFAPERVQEAPNDLLTPSIQASQESITSNGLTNNANLSPNTAPPQNQQATSTPVNIPTSQPDLKRPASLIKTYPIDMAPAQDRMEFTVWKYDPNNRNINSPSTTIPAFGQTGGGDVTAGYTQVGGAGFVYLPVTRISDTNSVDWQEDKINEFQRSLGNLSLGLMQSLSEDAYQEAFKQGGNLFQFAKNNNSFGNLVRLSLAGQAIGVNGLLTRATGAILNPNLELLFNGPILRQFGFGFDLLSKNKAEADRVKEIIKFFKQNMAVRDGVGSIGESSPLGNNVSTNINEGTSVFLNSPYVFRIKYLAGATGDDVNAKDHQSIGRIKMCALQSCNVDYTPMGSYMTFNDIDGDNTIINTMFMYRLNLQFKELTPIYSSDYTTHKIGF